MDSAFRLSSDQVVANNLSGQCRVADSYQLHRFRGPFDLDSLAHPAAEVGVAQGRDQQVARFLFGLVFQEVLQDRVVRAGRPDYPGGNVLDGLPWGVGVQAIHMGDIGRPFEDFPAKLPDDAGVQYQHYAGNFRPGNKLERVGAQGVLPGSHALATSHTGQLAVPLRMAARWESRLTMGE